ncbi:MAG: DUF1554 domain-containing protein [Candidatus Aenigmarchaeota archaeon]|nr:DUF1554 domain-containing protein [Candidatus Aenigmarchaeota archaeon]
MKGVSPIIAVILLILIAIAILGISSNMFISIQQSSSEQVGNAAGAQTENVREVFRVVQTDNNNVYIRNMGTLDMAPPLFLVDDALAGSGSDCTTIKPQQTCEFTVSVPGTGTYELVIEGKVAKLKATLDVETVVTTTTTTTSTTTTTIPSKRVFLSSSAYNGNLGGLAGADAKCQGLAEAAGLGGTWVAWLSTSTVDAKDRIPDIRYFRPSDKATVATSKVDLTNGNINNPINIDEKGAISLSGFVWTGTQATGMKDIRYCEEWTSSDNAKNGLVGSRSNTDSKWTKLGYSMCNSFFRVYCFET